MKIGTQYLPMIHPARKFFELLCLEHLENRELHNSYTKDKKRIKPYSEKNMGDNRRGVHSADWIRDVISETFIDPSFIAFLKPLINDRRYDRKPILPFEIDLEFTKIPIEAYYICNDPTVRSFVDVLILERASDETIAELVKEFDFRFEMEPDSIKKYRYFFFNIPFDLALRKVVLNLLQDIASIDPIFKRSYKPELSVLSEKTKYSDALNSLGYEDETNSYERKLFKNIINATARELDRLIKGGKSDLFHTVNEAVSSLKNVGASYIALSGILKSEPVITDTVMTRPFGSSELSDLSRGEQEAIFDNRMDGILTREQIADIRKREKEKRELTNGKPESKKTTDGKIKDDSKSADPKEDKDKDNPKPPVKKGPRKG